MHDSSKDVVKPFWQRESVTSVKWGYLYAAQQLFRALYMYSIVYIQKPTHTHPHTHTFKHIDTNLSIEQQRANIEFMHIAASSSSIINRKSKAAAEVADIAARVKKKNTKKEWAKDQVRKKLLPRKPIIFK